MSNDFYIQIGHEHQGPYSKEAIRGLLDEGKIDSASLIWSNGWENWKTVSQVEGLQAPEMQSEEVIDPPADLPPLPEKSLDLNINDEEKVQDRNKPHRLPLYFSILIISFGIATGFFIKNYTEQSKLTTRPEGMLEADYQRIQTFLTTTSRNKITWDLAWSRDRSTIWLASSLNAVGEVHVQFESIPSKVMDLSSLKFKAKGVLNRHLIKLENFEFLEGQRIAEGFYKAHIFTDDGGGLKPSLTSKFLGEGEQHLNSRTEIFIGHGGVKAFSEKQSLISDKVKEIRKKHSEILIQSYHTLLTALGSLEDSALGSLDKAKNSSQMKTFFWKYERESAKLLSDLVVESRKTSAGLKDHLKKSKVEYKNFSDQVLEVSQYFLEVSGQLKKTKRYTLEFKQDFINQFRLKIQSFKEKSFAKIYYLESDFLK